MCFLNVSNIGTVLIWTANTSVSGCMFTYCHILDERSEIPISYITLICCVECALYVFLQKEHKSSL
jgi:hypothetical protein